MAEKDDVKTDNVTSGNNDIGFEPSKVKGSLPEVEDIEKTAMEDRADKNVKFNRILATAKFEDEKQHGDLNFDNTFPPELVIQISETVAYAISCKSFVYNVNEASITGECISLWFPMFSRKGYYTITSILIIINKIFKCSQAIGAFLGINKGAKQ